MAEKPPQIYEFGVFRLDVSEHLLTRKGKPIALTPKAFNVLLLLIERGGHLVEKDELIREVWADSFVEEANLSRTIWMLRQALDDDRNGHGIIQTVSKHGYRFTADVRVVEGAETDGASNGAESKHLKEPQIAPADAEQTVKPFEVETRDSEQEITTAKASFWPRNRLVIVGITAALLLAAALVLVLTTLTTNDATTVAPIKSLAVLPLENSSGDATQQYIADGVTEGLIASISRAKTVRVTATKSAMSYKATAKPLSEIASELGVEALLVGTFVNDGNGVRVESRLVDTATGVTLWSNSYSRDLSNIWALQNEIAREIIGKLGAETQPELSDEPQVNPEAYDLYLRGRFRVSDDNPENIREAIDLQERATRLDPTFALAWAELAQICNLYAFYYTPEETQWKEKAFVAVEQANRLDPELPEAHLARASLLWTRKNTFPHEQAIQEYRRALELNPSLDEARHQLGRIYMHIGLYDMATAEYQLSLAINPTHAKTRFRFSVVSNYRHNYEEFLNLQNSLPADIKAPTKNYQRAWSLCHLQRFDEASSLVEEWRRSNAKDEEGGLLTSMQALLAAHKGNEQEAEKYIKLSFELGGKFSHFHHSAFTIAAAYAILNKPEKAMKWLQFAAENGFPNYPLFANDPDFANLRQDPRFNEFMAKQRKQWEQRMKTL